MATSYLRGGALRGLSMLDEAAVGAALAATRFGPLRYARETGSTNDDAAALLADERNLGTIVFAEHQRTGRGRRGRQWIDVPGTSLLCTSILPHRVAATALWAVPFWCALAVAAGVERATHVRLALQWPNDLLLGGRKACGILSVSRVAGDSAAVGCGVGLNVVRPAGGPDERAYISDSAVAPSRDAILIAIVDAFDESLAQLDDPRAVALAWERRAGLPGTRYRVLRDGETEPFDAEALGLANDGGLVLADGTGERVVSLADARVLRG